jgi:predicted nucleic acid-binding protein
LTVLVDTSVWIDFIRGGSRESTGRLRVALDGGVLPAITSSVYQEILQGAVDERTFREYRSYFRGQPFLQPLDPGESHERAARIYFDCRRKGLTVRSSIDCLIAQIAMEHDVPLLHDDGDFEQIARVLPKLRFFQ